MQSRRLFCEVAAGILAAESRLRRTVRFGDCVLDPASGEFEREGARRRLQEQPLRVLELLTMRPGEVVTREELVACLWPTGTVVDFDTGLNTAVRKLRAALGDDANAPRYVETIPRRGYRLLVPAVVEAASTEALPKA